MISLASNVDPDFPSHSLSSHNQTSPIILDRHLIVWLVVLRINVDLAIFQPYLDLEAGDNQSLKIQVARPGSEPWFSCPQAKSLTTRPPLLPGRHLKKTVTVVLEQ